jgi:two-component system, NtrC family, response regulator AtoC
VTAIWYDLGCLKEPEATRTVAGLSDATPYLLVVARGRAERCDLTGPGPWIVGRGSDCEVAIEDTSISRQHARLSHEAGGVMIRDLGSRNGTRVNGAPVLAGCRVQSGDVIALGEALLVPYLGRATGWSGDLEGARPILARLESEVDRATRFERPLSIAVLDLRGAEAKDVPTLLRAELRRSDAAGVLEPGLLLLVFPERDGDACDRAVRSLLSSVVVAAPEARAGIAAYPADGADAPSLLDAARDAARGTSDRVARGHDAGWKLELGGRSCRIVDPGMRRIFELLEKLAASDLPVLLSGETGTGKELAAAAVHAWSPRQQGPFVPVNCAALPASLFESELFGYRRGAFTGAVADKPGYLAAAAGGTLFLDEIADLPLEA